jgi:hypothetical protein
MDWVYLHKSPTSCWISRTGPGLDPIWSNMFPKPSSSEFSNARSESNTRGGVTVLAVLVVTALLLVLSVSGGRPLGDEVGDDRVPLVMPKERARGGLRMNPARADEGGGTGMSLNGPCPEGCIFFSDRASTDDGFVEEVLRRAEDAALSICAVECECSVPALPLDTVSMTVIEIGHGSAYRLPASRRPLVNISPSSSPY